MSVHKKPAAQEISFSEILKSDGSNLKGFLELESLFLHGNCVKSGLKAIYSRNTTSSSS